MRIVGLARVALALVVATTAALAAVQPVAAECAFFDRWPSFSAIAPGARTIVLVEVVEGTQEDSTDHYVAFGVEVRDRVRGEAPDAFAIAAGTSFSQKITCPDSILRAHEGDVLALALAKPPAAVLDRVLAVAWVEGKPARNLMPGVETLTAAQVRRLAELPATDAATVSTPAPASAPPILPLLLAAALGSLLLERRRRLGRSR